MKIEIKRVFGGLLLAAVVICAAGCKDNGAGPDKPDNTVTKANIDGYKTGKIGDLEWMLENLNHKTGKSWCYDNKEANCSKYGRLYDWNTAAEVCPTGWHLSTKADWDNLVETAGGVAVAGKKLKSTNGWEDFGGKSGNGTNDYGFNAMPVGECSLVDGILTCYLVGQNGGWWEDEEYSGASNVYARVMWSATGEVFRGLGSKSLNYESVRCVKD